MKTIAACLAAALAVTSLCAGLAPADEILAEGAFPVPSPDGRRLAFHRPSADGRSLGVAVLDLASGRLAELEKKGVSAFPAWSPDGAALVYTCGADETTAFEAMQSGKGGGYGVRLRRDGGTTDLTSGRRRDQTPSFSSDGRYVWFSLMHDEGKAGTSGFCRSMLARVRADRAGGTPEVVLAPPYGKGSCGMSQPAVSPDGRRLVWSETDWYSRPWILKTAPLGKDGLPVTNAVRTLSPAGMAAYAPRWSPDGRHVVFTGHRAGDPSWCVYALHVETGRFRRLATGTDGAFAPDMRALYYSRDGKIRRRRIDARDLPGTGAFRRIAYVDSLDFAVQTDIETRAGTRAVIDHVLLTGADTLLWRSQGGGVPRYPSAEEGCADAEMPFNRMRVGTDNGPGGVYGWLRTERGENLVEYALQDCARRGVTPGIHQTFEENHWNLSSLSSWNLAHPQYWCRRRDGTFFSARCSYAYPEVMAHKMRLFDELLAMKPEMLLMDMFRGGCWMPDQEYVPPMTDEWRRRYGCEPPKDHKDPRWMRLVSERQHAYFREMRARIEATGRKTEFIVGLVYMDEKDEATWNRYAFDWKEMLATGVIDGVAVQSVVPDPKDLWGSTARIYRHFAEKVHALGGTVYFPVAQYGLGGQYGYPRYAKELGIPREEAVRKLVELARTCGGDGIVMECVDYDNYKDAERAAIRADVK